MPQEREQLKVAVVNLSDARGGAAVVSLRLTEALRDLGVDAKMVVVEKLTDNPNVVTAAKPSAAKRPFLAERLRIFLQNGFNRRDLFKMDIASDGLPLWRHPVIKEADVICLNWVNQGMLSLKGLKRLIDMGKPIVWVMHDSWAYTGGCHITVDCPNYMSHCAHCDKLGNFGWRYDLSYRHLKKKRKVYEYAMKRAKGGITPLTFVGVSTWLSRYAESTPLFKELNIPVEVIPNAFPTSLFPAPENVVEWRKGGVREHPGEFVVAMGAARLDDPVKGLPILLMAEETLRHEHPQLAERTRLVTFGNVRDPHAFDKLQIKHTHLGPVKGTEEVREILRGADVVVSSSVYESLPGTLVEGQACGAIPVSFDRGGQNNIIDHLSTGYLAEIDGCENLETIDDIVIQEMFDAGCNLSDGLAWAASQGDDIRERMARSVVEKFSAEVVARRYLDLFRRVLGQSN